MTLPATTFLNNCQIGHYRVVRADDPSLAQLKSMGLVEGRAIEIWQVGNPTIIRIGGSKIGISARLTGLIEVQLA